MTSLAERQRIIKWLDEAVSTGARQSEACRILSVSQRTIQRWREKGVIRADRRLQRQFEPANKLSQAEQMQILSLVNSAEFAELPPNQIVPRLADRGEYIASESTFYRLLRNRGQLRHRQATRPATPRKAPKALTAVAPNQVYCWDITYLPTLIQGLFYYLYVFVDLYSRKIVGWQIHERESSEWAAHILQDIATKEKIKPGQVVLHSDNGSPMKGATLMATLHQLGIEPSYSRPAVSNDNPYSESLFKTLKYRPNYPEQPFSGLLQARRWVTEFVDWYNHVHRHSRIRFVTPAQRHAGLDKDILAQRQATYQAARRKNPARWSGQIRKWNPVTEVKLNHSKDKQKCQKQSYSEAA